MQSCGYGEAGIDRNPVFRRARGLYVKWPYASIGNFRQAYKSFSSNMVSKMKSIGLNTAGKSDLDNCRDRP